MSATAIYMAFALIVSSATGQVVDRLGSDQTYTSEEACAQDIPGYAAFAHQYLNAHYPGQEFYFLLSCSEAEPPHENP